MPSLGDHPEIECTNLLSGSVTAEIIAPETRQPFLVAAVLPHDLAAHDEERKLRAAMLGVLRWEVNEAGMPVVS
jgi:hypothetical protein